MFIRIIDEGPNNVAYTHYQCGGEVVLGQKDEVKIMWCRLCGCWSPFEKWGHDTGLLMATMTKTYDRNGDELPAPM